MKRSDRNALREGPLQFEYKTALEELTILPEMAKDYLDGSAPGAFTALRNELEKVRRRPAGCRLRWETQEHMRISTKPSRDYQAGHQSSGTVRGVLEFTWEIENVEERGKKKGVAHKRFQLVGLASTRIYLYGDDDKLVARWNFDVGDAASPGCHFHVQLAESKEALAASSAGQTQSLYSAVDVPRWPSVIFTPSDAVDFVLGELFQEGWRKEADRYARNQPRWATLQKKRLTEVLSWMHRRVEKSDGAAWLSLKAAKPPVGLLLSSSK
ncbi:hypothetical protein [Haliangium ochraceum]|uniref:Uncharacterized protein n=1 Tax=Haliangium ochraceum (strain DSM 14365 / JCM 11303 / SMP-2) TaxID=502025 RepID=D0LJH1_HALO1|nr:hypothetical protein [Haliangium ochraceum]ACY16545.1 hypothetical protein Hoch_4046 [Haliangium ochraceum DSM 14365]